MTLPPARHYFEPLGFTKQEDILDFGLKKTPLVQANTLAQWLGVKECFLKVEVSHPTGTVKDRSTELSFSYFVRHNMQEYIHASTGNTATSLAWGLSQYKKPFSLTLIIPGKQLSHHNFEKQPGLNTILLEEATYDEARAFRQWYVKQKGLVEAFAGFKAFRSSTYQVPYLESYEEISQRGFTTPDYVFQAISGGSGIVGAHLATQYAVEQGWLSHIPKISIAQPTSADVIARCYNDGAKKYHDQYTQVVDYSSKAFAIRRGDATGLYEKVKHVLDETGGIAVSVSEEEIIEAKEVLERLEGIDAGYTACVSLAGIRKQAHRTNMKESCVMVLLTGRDRPTDVQPKIDEVINKAAWKEVLDR